MTEAINTEAKSVITDWSTRFNSIPFSKIASNEWYAPTSDLVPIRARAKQEFIDSGVLVEPNLSYPRLTPRDIDPLEAQYQRLLNEATTDEQFEQAAKRLAEVYRHKEVMRGIGSIGVRSSQSQERAGAMSAEIYGDIDVATHKGLVRGLRAKASRLSGVMHEASELLNLLGDVGQGEWHNPGVLEQETIDTLHKDFEEIFPGAIAVFDNVRNRERVSAQEALHYGQALLDHVGLGEQGWRYILVTGSSSKASTNAAQKTIAVGELTAEYIPTQMIKTDFHEMIHAIRMSGAFTKPNPAFEEALCVAVEQIVSGEIRAGSGEQYYTAIGLQQGHDQNGRQRNFREVYEIMWRRALVLAASKGENLSIDVAKDRAYTEVLRTRRGGATDTRDIAYFSGSQIVPKWLNDLSKHPKEEQIRLLKWVFSASFDPTNPAHVADYPPESYTY